MKFKSIFVLLLICFHVHIFSWEYPEINSEDGTYNWEEGSLCQIVLNIVF
jgi:hypothetical protein